MPHSPVITPLSVPHSGRHVWRCLGLGWVILLALVMMPSPALLHADVKTGIGDKPSKKDRKDNKPTEFLPEARDSSARFIAGKSVDIEIEASVATVKQVEFVIRQQPVNGTLSGLRPHPRETNKGIVTYTHNSVDAPVTDRFTFACRIGDGPISAPATVTLTGQKFEPILSVQNVTSMGKVFLGGESSLRFTIKNIGPAAYDEDMTWESPWRGPPHLALKTGETAELSVGFQPSAPGIFRLDRLLQPGQNTSRLLLYGECIRPLTISPGKIVLTLSGEGGTREATLTLANGLNSPQKVDLKLPPRVSGPATVEVPGAGQTKVLLKLAAQDVAALKDELIVSTPDGRQTIYVEADAKAAVLQLLRPADGVLDLGTVLQGGEAHGEVVLKNNGGLPAVVQALTGASVRISPIGEAVRIEAGAETKFSVSLKGEQVGHLQTEAHIQGAGLLLRVPVKLNVTPLPKEKVAALSVANSGGTNPVAPVEGGTPAPASLGNTAPAPIPSRFKPYIAFIAASGLPIPKEMINPALEQIRQIEIRARSSTSITIAWAKPQVAPAGWIIESASWARLPTGEVIKAWVPMKTWELVDAGDKSVGVRLNSLSPASHIEIRLMGADRDGKVSEPATFAMETTARWQVPSWVWRVCGATALLVVLVALYRIKEGYWDPTWEPLRKLLRL